MYYLCCGQLALNEVKVDLYSGKYVIFERYIYSTLVTHLAFDEVYANGAERERIRTLVNVAEKNMVTTDVVIFLHLAEHERLKRLSKRDESQNYQIDWDTNISLRTSEKFREIAKQLKSEGRTPILELDTTNLSIDQTVTSALRFIRSIKPK